MLPASVGGMTKAKSTDRVFAPALDLHSDIMSDLSLVVVTALEQEVKYAVREVSTSEPRTKPPSPGTPPPPQTPQSI
eukprot:1678730-Amphidinium_carterae.1